MNYEINGLNRYPSFRVIMILLFIQIAGAKRKSRLLFFWELEVIVVKQVSFT